MKRPQETAKRWLAQAEHSLGVGRLLLENRVWADACFQAEQSAQMALKAFLYSRGKRFVLAHSVRELALECGKEDPDFSPLVDHGGFLDRYYLATRYPDVLPAPAVPFESFTEREAQQALTFATEILDSVRAKVRANPSAPAV